MVFSSATFLFYFLPITLLLYYVSPRFSRNALLVIVSLLFYLWGAGIYTALLLLSVAVNYVLGLVLGGMSPTRPSWRQVTLAAGIVFNLSILAYFKYANFFVLQLNDVGQRLEWGVIAWNNIILPIGISFYTFHAMSYIIDASLYLSPELALAATWKEFAILALGSLVVLLPRDFNGGAFLAENDGRWAAPARAAILLVVFPYAIVEAVGSTFSPFLYFQF